LKHGNKEVNIKVLIVVDKIPSAIWVCGARPMERLRKWCDIDIVAVHPKRPSKEQLDDFEGKAIEADIIDFQYWKSAEMLMGRFPFLRDKPKVLTHHNPYDVDLEDWFKKYDRVIVKNQTQKKIIKDTFKKEPLVIPHSTNLGFFEFQREYPNENIFKVLMVVARIEGKKGVLEVAKACRQTKTRFILVGRISDMNYFREIMTSAGDYIDFRQDITDEKLKEAYYEAHLVINNSVDGFESGTLIHLEAMGCGVPVLTREIGLVPDIANGKNMVVRGGTKDNIKELAEYIEMLKKDREKRLRLREEGFKSVLCRDDEYCALRYYRVYREVLGEGKPLVSVIIPTYNREKTLIASLVGLVRQDYPNLEIIVVDDGSKDGTKKAVKEFKEMCPIPIRYIKQKRMGYGLARARNTGVVEANGKILVFQDDRYLMNPNAISELVAMVKPRTWVFGDKGAQKRDFVENFSCVYKRDLVDIGMFNERIVYYGAMTRDILSRMSNRIIHQYCANARCTVLLDSKSKFKKKPEIVKAKLLLWKLRGSE